MTAKKTIFNKFIILFFITIILSIYGCGDDDEKVKVTVTNIKSHVEDLITFRNATTTRINQLEKNIENLNAQIETLKQDKDKLLTIVKEEGDKSTRRSIKEMF